MSRVAPTLVEHGSYAYPWLGISGASLSLDLIEAMNLDVMQRGALVVTVAADGPAAKAGLRGASGRTTVAGQELPLGGDLITAIDGSAVQHMDDLIAYLVKETQPGDTVTLTVLRDGEELSLPVTLGERPPA